MTAVLSAFRLLPRSLVALGAVACLGETTLVTPPKAPVTSFTLSFRADSADVATATSLDWASGIHGVTVTVTPDDSSAGAPQHFQASDDGTLTLDQLAAGTYEVDAVRWLSAGERAAEVPVDMPASRPGSLLFTEWAMLPAENPALGGYFFGGYVVIANNSDSTIYLDGMLLGRATSQPFEIPGAPCADRIAFYSDPKGLWSADIYRFPGTGRDYPIGPGEHKLIATDAIDHRTIIPDGYDLRGADFEFLSYADVDNPNVPNLTSVGLSENVFGHGLTSPGGADVWYLALPTDVTSLPQAVLPYTSSKFLRIPGDRVLDVVTHLVLYKYSSPLCGTYVHPRFDRKTPELLGPYMYESSIQRLRTGADRAGPYQWTRSSDADFRRAPKTAPR
jgi:hypothetical protein